MLNPQALANGFSGATILLYISLYLLKVLATPLFELIFNTQYLGADVASQIPQISFLSFLGALIAIGVITWVFGYLVAEIYNRYARKGSGN